MTDVPSRNRPADARRERGTGPLPADDDEAGDAAGAGVHNAGGRGTRRPAGDGAFAGSAVDGLASEVGAIMRVEFTAQIRVGEGRTVCTDNTITVDDAGAVLLHMQLMPEGSPILDLAIQPQSPVAVITAVVSTIISAAATTAHPGSGQAS